MEMFVIMTWEYRIIKFIYKDRQTIIIIPKIYKYQKIKTNGLKMSDYEEKNPFMIKKGYGSFNDSSWDLT
jgi:hypothetical protein